MCGLRDNGRFSVKTFACACRNADLTLVANFFEGSHLSKAMKNNNEIISIREFARRVGVSDTAIRKAIKLGKIKMVQTGSQKGINYETGLQAVKDFGIGAIYNEKNTENNILEPTIPNVAAKTKADTATFQESKRREAYFKSELARLEYEKESNILVNKQEVYKQLFALAKEIKNQILLVPDRCIDEILEAESRNESHTILLKELNETLVDIANFRFDESKFAK